MPITDFKGTPYQDPFYYFRCEVDASTHIISQSMHETKFVFEEFEYALNKKGVYLYCDARFCATSDYSQSCQQRCQSFG